MGTRRLFAAAVALTVVALATSSAYAIPFTVTDSASMAAQSLVPAVGPPIPQANLIGASGGRLLTNQFGGIAVGTPVNTVGAVPIGSVTHTAGFSTVNGIVAPGGGVGSPQLVALFGVQGSITQVFVGGANATFTSGGLQVVELPAGTTFAQNDVSTWGIGTGTILGTWSLKGQENIISGQNFGIAASQPVNFPAADVNVSGVNTAVGGLGQGLFLFDEVAPNNFLNSDSGLAAILTILGFTVLGEDIAVPTDQVTTSLDNDDLNLGLAANQDILDALANWAFGADFANWGSGDVDDFIVTIMGGAPVDGPGGFDFIANLLAEGIPGIQAEFIPEIPEPTSVLAWSVVGLISGLGLWWRRRRAVA